MRPRTIEIFNQPERNVVFADFKQITSRMENVKVSADKIDFGYTFNMILIDYGVVKFLEIDGKFFLIYNTGHIKKITDTGISQIYQTQPGKSVNIYRENYLGEEGYLLLIEGENAVFINQQLQSVDLQIKCLKHSVKLANTYFTGEGNKLKFFTLVETDGVKTDSANSFLMPLDAGDIVGLVAEEKRVKIFCRHAIMQLTPFGDKIDFYLQRLTLPILDIEQDSVVKMGYRSVFLSNGEITVFDGKQVKTVKTCFDLKNYSVYNKCALWSVNKYVLPIVVKERREKYLFVYDFTDDSECIIPSGECAVSDLGYLVKNSLIYQVSNNGEMIGEHAIWESKPTGFINGETTSLKEIFVNSNTDGDFELKLLGDFGEKTAKIKKGRNTKKLNVNSQEYAVKVEHYQPISFNNVRLKLRIRGNR